MRGAFLICQYHLRKRVGQTVGRHFSKTRTHPLTQVVLAALPSEGKSLKRLSGILVALITRLKPSENERENPYVDGRRNDHNSDYSSCAGPAT
jgi:hypothetical protein